MIRNTFCLTKCIFFRRKKELKILYRISINVIGFTFKYVISVNDLYRREK